MKNTLSHFRDRVVYSARVPVKLLCNLLDPPVVVLLYHRVATLRSDPEMLAVSPDTFREQVRYLQRNYRLVRFDDDWRGAARPAVAITFDDGYRDNVAEALPILEEFGVPATFFITTGTIGAVDANREFWWHELERILLGGGSLPPCLTLDGPPGWQWPTVTPEERSRCYRDLVRLLTDADPGLRDDCLSRVSTWGGDDRPERDNQAMSVEELRRLAASPLATIGAHTVTHTRLSSLSPAAQRKEITDSKSALESLLGRKITVFSYPFGRRSDYSDATIRLCREAGFTKVAANFPGQVHRWTDPFQVPRHLVRDWSVDMFGRKLERFWRS